MSLHFIYDAGFHKALLCGGGRARLFLCRVIPLYYSVATALGVDGTVPFLLQEDQIGHCRPAIFYAEILWFIWIQGIHSDQMMYFLLNRANSALNEAMQAMLHVILSHDNLRNP